MNRRAALIVTVVSVLVGSPGVRVVNAQQVPVVEGELTPQYPFGICPATNKPRTAADFYQLFGYLPEPYASQSRIRSTPPSNWPKTYYTPKRTTSAAPKNNVASTVLKNNVPSSAPKNHVASTAPKNVVPPNPGTRPPSAGQHLVGPTGRTEGIVPASPGHVAPPRNVVPANNTASTQPISSKAAGASTASKPASPVQPPRNQPFNKTVAKLTPENVREMKNQLGAHEEKLLDDLARLAAGSPEARRAIDNLRDRVASNSVNGKDLADVAKAVQNLPQAARDAALKNLGGIATDEQVKQWLDGQSGRGATNLANGATNGDDPRTAANNTGGRNANGADGRVAGNNPTGGVRRNPLGINNRAGGADPAAQRTNPPVGAAAAGAGRRNVNVNIAIGVIPALPAGMVIPLGGVDGGFGGGFGGGPALMGMGQPGDQIAMGMGDPAEMAGLPMAPPDAVPAPGAPPTPPSFGDALLINAGNGPIAYTINDEPSTLQPSEQRTLPTGTLWTVEFDRGNGTGSARYSLPGGTYEFQIKDNGWELVQKSFETTIDNTQNPTPFGFVTDNQLQTVPPGESQTITGKFPPIVRFDDGTGQVKERQLGNSKYRPALDGSQTLDIYLSDTLASAAPPAPAPITPGDATVNASPAATSLKLPPGFRMFDPMEALTKPEVGMSLPPEFNLFRSAAAEFVSQERIPVLFPVQ